MAVLDETQRNSVWVHIMRNMRDFLDVGETSTALKAEYRFLVDDLDAWLDSQATEANQAIRVGIRTKFSAVEKNRALALICAKRGGLLKVGG